VAALTRLGLAAVAEMEVRLGSTNQVPAETCQKMFVKGSDFRANVKKRQQIEILHICHFS
jgi:hypothetical protein